MKLLIYSKDGYKPISLEELAEAPLLLLTNIVVEHTCVPEMKTLYSSPLFDECPCCLLTPDESKSYGELFRGMPATTIQRTSLPFLLKTLSDFEMSEDDCLQVFTKLLSADPSSMGANMEKYVIVFQWLLVKCGKVKTLLVSRKDGFAFMAGILLDLLEKDEEIRQLEQENLVLTAKLMDLETPTSPTPE